VQGGFAFGYSAFLNGVFLGSNQGTPSVSLTTDVWTIPDDILMAGEDNVLTVFQGKREYLVLLQRTNNTLKIIWGVYLRILV
jgi:hypothetical protein